MSNVAMKCICQVTYFLQFVESDDLCLGYHPLSGLDGAGVMLQLLRKQFHSFLQTISDLIPKVGIFEYVYFTNISSHNFE